LRLLDFSLKCADKIGWGARKTPAFSPKFLEVAGRSIYTANAEGNLWINLGWINRTSQELEFRQVLREGLLEIPVFAAKVKDALDTRFSIDEWGSDVERFIATIESAIGTHK
jgi:hypothetical protein